MSLVEVRTDGPSLVDGYRSVVGDGPIRVLEALAHRLKGHRVAMVGDLANGRTVRSLTYLLSKFKDIKIWFVAPPEVAMRDDIKAHLTEHNVPWVETEDLDVSAARDLAEQVRGVVAGSVSGN